MQIGDKAVIKNGKFSGVEGIIVKGDGYTSYQNIGGKIVNEKSYMQITLRVDNFNTIVVDSDDIEVIDDFPREFSYEDDYNFIAISSNIGDWNRAIEEYNINEDRDVIFVETDNYSQDDEEVVHDYISMSIPQAKYLVKSLDEIVEYIENKSKTEHERD